jgi:hypothetical protein
LCIAAQNTCPAAMAFCVDIAFSNPNGVGATTISACSNVNPNP